MTEEHHNNSPHHLQHQFLFMLKSLQLCIPTNQLTVWLHLLFISLCSWKYSRLLTFKSLCSLSSSHWACLRFFLPPHLSLSLPPSPRLPHHTQSGEAPHPPPLEENFHYLSIRVNPSDGFVFADSSSSNLVPSLSAWLYQLSPGRRPWFLHSGFWETRQRAATRVHFEVSWIVSGPETGEWFKAAISFSFCPCLPFSLSSISVEYSEMF